MAASIPAGTSAGLPVGLQLVAAPGAEGVLVRTGVALEDRLGMAVRRIP